MNYLNLVFTSIRKNKLTFILIILEIASLLLTVNLLVSTIYDRQMLDVAYRDILRNNSAFVWDVNYIQKKANGLVQDVNHSRSLLLDEIEGEYKVYDTSVMYGDVNIIAVSDEIFDNLSLPLVSGNYNEAVSNFECTSGKYSYTYFNGVDEQSIDIEISGVLTANTFLPLMRSYSTGNEFTTKDFYLPSNYFDKFIITKKSSVEELESKFTTESGFIIQFNDKNYEKNLDILSTIAGVKKGSEIINNSQQALYKDLIDFIPVLTCVFFSVLIGTVSISIIMNSKNKYQSGILWLCGYSRRQIVYFHFVSMIVIFVVSVIIYGCAYALFSFMELELFVSTTFSLANIITTVVICSFLLVVSMIIPMIKSYKSSPIEYLRRAK